MENMDREWGSEPIKKVELSDKERDQLHNFVVEVGQSRKRNGSLKDETDFFIGAMAVMERLGIGCPVWAIKILAGRKVLE